MVRMGPNMARWQNRKARNQVLQPGLLGPEWSTDRILGTLELRGRKSYILIFTNL